MRELMVPVWQEDEYQKDILWAGTSGPVSPNRTKEESVVDIVIVLKNHMRSGFEPAAADLDEKLAVARGREISLACVWQGSFFALGTISVLRAPLSSRAVYGPHADVEHLRRDAMAILHDSLKRLNLAAHAVDNIKEQVALRATSRAKD